MEGSAPPSQQPPRRQSSWAKLQDPKLRAVLLSIQRVKHANAAVSLEGRTLEARLSGEDCLGFGFSGWQMPWALVYQAAGTLHTLMALIDGGFYSGGGQLCAEPSCGGDADEEDWGTVVTMEQLLAVNRTSVHPIRDAWETAPAMVSGGGGGDDDVHPSVVRRWLWSIFVLQGIVTFLLFAGIFGFKRLLLLRRWSSSRTGEPLELGLACGITLLVALLYLLLYPKALATQPGLRALHHRGEVAAADFDPDMVAAYAFISMVQQAIVASLIGAACLSGIVGSRRGMPVAASTVKQRRKQSAIWLGGACYIVASFFLFWWLEPEVMPTLAHAFYYVVVTGTTVGYGDISPQTPAGRVCTV